MNKTGGLAIVILAILVGGLLFVRSLPTNPVAILQVVDTAGKPIAGAVIRPDGLRPKRINAHYGWSQSDAVKPAPVTTDAHGFARVPYPRYVSEKIETGEISFSVEHTNYCSDRPFRVVSAVPPANAKVKDKFNYVFMFVTRRIVSRPEPVVLKQGGIVTVTGYIGTKENLARGFHAQLATMPLPRNGYWLPTESGALINNRVPEGMDAVRLVYFPDTGGAYFSDVKSFLSAPGKTNEFCLELKPGLRFAGQLEKTAPRPVKNGRVQISVLSEADNTTAANNKIVWQASGTVGDDGTFAFEASPPGEVEVTVLCDGFKSMSGPGGMSSFIMPQTFKLIDTNVNVVIAMEPTATCQITVVDDSGKPLKGASVYFWPNVLWHNRGSTIFMRPTFTTEGLLRSDEDFHWQEFQRTNIQVYEARSDEHGVAIVSNLPAFRQRFAVDRDGYEMPISTSENSRDSSVSLMYGETAQVTVTMQKKGTQFLQSPP